MIMSRGNPAGGMIIRAGATVDLPEFWADKFIADGSAEEVAATPKTEKPAAEKKPAAKGKKK